MKNRTLGSILIVAGTTIGAGMLAMPLATAGVGFGATLLILILIWLLMSYTALLFLEVYQHHPIQTGLAALAKCYLGKIGYGITGFNMLFLMYALTSAYISGAGELIASTISAWTGQSFSSVGGVLIFTLMGGAVVCVGTQILMLAVMAPHIRIPHLLTLPLQQGLVLSAIPIIFTSFGFHGSIPSIVHYMGGHVRKLRCVFIVGSAIPLIAYIFWQLVTLGSISSETFIGILAQKTGLNALLEAARTVLNFSHVEVTLHLFSDFALVTSFLGVALGLFDYLADLFKRSDTAKGRFQTGVMTFLPPLIFALFYPNGFIMALGFAAIALAVLALILPALMVWKVRKIHQGNYQVWGGKPGLLLVLGCGFAVMGFQIDSVVL